MKYNLGMTGNQKSRLSDTTKGTHRQSVSAVVSYWSLIMTYFGYYNESGYWISQPHNGQPLEIYRAGNSPYDSAQVLPLDDPHRLTLEQIRQYCDQTGQDMAEEEGVNWGGAEYEEIDD